MPAATIASALPGSHYFISICHGQTIRTVRIRVGVARAAGALLVALAAWLVASSGYLVVHDDLLASLMARESAAQYAYEDRIAALRGQVDREASATLVGQTSMDARLKALAARAAVLETRAGLLAATAAQAGIPAETRAMPDTAAVAEPAGRVRETAPKPRLESQSSAADRPTDLSAVVGRPSFNARFALTEERLARVAALQTRDLDGLADAARHRAEALRAALLDTGLPLDRIGPKTPEPALGGPFVPLDPAIARSPFGRTLDAMASDVATVHAVEQAVARIPVGKPLDGALEVTSPFGARLDPFLGRAAMHTGVDLREESGTEVRATADGRVVSAGVAGGYGLMVELDHGHGLATRYAHLSAISVSPGQSLAKGAVVGEVGATGRATGPHLHYETRIDGEAVDPERFLDAGTRLAALDRAP